jgi:hypothetical protein
LFLQIDREKVFVRRRETFCGMNFAAFTLANKVSLLLTGAAKTAYLRVGRSALDKK